MVKTISKKCKIRIVAAIFLLLLLIIPVYNQTLTYPIVDTDVSEFYSDTALITPPGEGQPFYGQDATYTGNQPSYTDNGNGTITDNITGLMWQQDMGDKMSYVDAVEYLKTMTLGGFSDWRIPDIKELYSLAVFTGKCMGETVIDKFIDTNYFEQPIGNESIGERQIDAQTWSKTHYVGLTMNGDTTIFGFNFVDGRLKGYPKYNPQDKTATKMYFRMVRGNTSYGKNQFFNNGDKTITDNATGLMWQQEDDGNTYDWESALNYAENLTLGDYNDWRLPNAKELQSIVDYTRSPSTTTSPAIDPMFSCTSIKDTDGNSGQYGYYWTSSPLKVGPNPYSDAVYICFGEAHGKMESPPSSGTYVLMDVHGAGAQRNDPKSGNASDYPDFHGPQGDVRYVYNFVRCVRNAGSFVSVGESFSDGHIKVFPNPCKKYLTLKTDEDFTIHITDLAGRIVYTSKIENNEKTIYLDNLSRGIYFLWLSNASTTQVQKIMKE